MDAFLEERLGNQGDRSDGGEEREAVVGGGIKFKRDKKKKKDKKSKEDLLD